MLHCAIAGLLLVAGIAAGVQGQPESRTLLAVARIAPSGPDVVQIVLQMVPLEASPPTADQVSNQKAELPLCVSISSPREHTTNLLQGPPSWVTQPQKSDQLQCLVNGKVLSRELPPEDQLLAGAPLVLSYAVGADDQAFNLDTMCLR
jgi:hypothetical protein